MIDDLSNIRLHNVRVSQFICVSGDSETFHVAATRKEKRLQNLFLIDSLLWIQLAEV